MSVNEVAKLLTVLVHAHCHALLQAARLALIAMSLVDHAATRSGLTSLMRKIGFVELSLDCKVVKIIKAVPLNASAAGN
jgi:hypothetical protein